MPAEQPQLDWVAWKARELRRRQRLTPEVRRPASLPECADAASSPSSGSVASSSSAAKSSKSNISPCRFSNLASFWRTKEDPDAPEVPKLNFDLKPGQLEAEDGAEDSHGPPTTTSAASTSLGGSLTMSSEEVVSPTGQPSSPRPLSPQAESPASVRREVELLSTPKTCRSGQSRRGTSIATPETNGRKSRESPSPSSKADSELELALELVNHVAPDVADALLERLRAAETAASRAEEQCERLFEEAKLLPVVVEEDDVPSWAIWRAALCWALLLAIVGWTVVAQLKTSAVAVPKEAWPTDSKAEGHDFKVCGLIDAEDPPEDSSESLTTACEALLWEAKQEAFALRRRHKELEAGYTGVLEAISHWTGFLQEVIMHRSASAARVGVDSHKLESRCQEAAKPGRTALEVLMPRQNADPASTI